MVEYTFVYSRITWTYTDGTLEHTDDWIAAR
jgi:type VI protein secretion system component Hcp